MGIRVLIKGLDKVIEFPTNTKLPDIEKSIKVNWNEVESLSGLPMDKASRMERAQHLGFDVDNPIYSGTAGELATEIAPYNATKFPSGNRVQGGNRFGGIFGSKDKSVAEAHGEVQTLLTKDHATNADFRHDVFYDDHLSEVADKNFRDIIGEHKIDIDGVTTEEIDELLEYAMGDKIIWDNDPDMGIDRLKEIMKIDSEAEIDWDFQGIKGELARRMGHDSVGMIDEHGESALVLNAKRADAEFNPANSNKGNLLASSPVAATASGGALGLLGLGGLLQPQSAEAKAKANEQPYKEGDPLFTADQAKGALDVLATVGSGLLGMSVGGIAGIVTGDAGAIDPVSKAFMREPSTDEGMEILQKLMPILGSVDAVNQFLSKTVGDAANKAGSNISPEVGAAAGAGARALTEIFSPI